MKQLLDQAILGNDDPRNLIKRHFPQLSLTPTSLHNGGRFSFPAWRRLP